MPVYLGANHASLNRSGVAEIKTGDDEAWSKRLRFCLEKLDTDYVLLLLEDFFLDRPVSTERIKAEVERLRVAGGVELRLYPNPGADYFRAGLGVIHTGAHYRISLQPAIWNRAELLKLLVDDESPWDFERLGTLRSRTRKDGFYCSAAPLIHYRHVVERGEWFRTAARHYAAANVGCDFGARPVMHLAKACKKVPSRAARRCFIWFHSRYLCWFHPEAEVDGV